MVSGQFAGPLLHLLETMPKTVDREGKTIWLLEEPSRGPAPSSAKGETIPSRPVLFQKHPAVAFSLSLLIWGGGHLYMRQWQWGIMYFLLMVNFYLFPTMMLLHWKPITVGLMTLDVTPVQVMVPLGIFFLVGLILWTGNAVHAYVSVADAERASFQGMRHPFLPGLCSLLIPGWGQILNGQLRKGVCYLFVAMVGFFALAMLLVIPFLWPMLLTPMDRQLAERVLLVAVTLLPVVVLVWGIAIYDAVKVCVDPLKKEPWRKRVEYAINRMRLKGWRGMLPRIELTVMVSLYLIFSLALSHYLFPRDYYVTQLQSLQVRLAQQQMHLISERLDHLIQKVSAVSWLPRRDATLL
jgi:TM2 domain-containing membrane protein YozV